MTQLPRLNNVIRALSAGQHALMTITPVDRAMGISLAASNYDGVIFESEHSPWDPADLQDTLQYMLSRGQIVKSGSIAPTVTPMVRIPPNGKELNQTYAKQALDLGIYGILWPHITTVEQAYNAISACRYPRLKSAPLYEPAGVRGDAPYNATRYWGVTSQEYYCRADVWPLAPDGEIFVMLQIEETEAIQNLRDILRNVAGIGAIVIGEGDLSQELGIPRQYDHPVLLEAMAEIVATCGEFKIPVGHPHVGPNNVERVIAEGYRLLLTQPVISYAALEQSRKLTGRA